MKLPSVVVKLDDWFFACGPVLNLCAVRILLGVCTLNYAFLLAPFLTDFFGDNGVVTAAKVQTFAGGPTLNLLYCMDAGGLHLFFAAFVLAALFMTAGLFTRWSTIAVFLGLVSFHLRNPFILNSGDLLLILAVFLLIFSPCGLQLSLDAVLSRGMWLPQDGIRRSLWTQRLLQLQLTAVYVDAVVSKLQGTHWLDGTAVYYVMHLSTFQHLPTFHLFDSMLVCRVATYFCLLAETLMCTAVWVPRLRMVALLSGVILHTGLEWCLNIPNFQAVILSLYILFVDPEWLAACIPLRRHLRKEILQLLFLAFVWCHCQSLIA